MKSIFTRTYQYRERENKNNLENYLIEIFAFSLENDFKFRENFFSEIGFDEKFDVYINTQSTYKGFGRPDIEIRNSNSILLIECKVESTERKNQLKDYLKILKNSDYENKWLIYLTKYYETKNIEIGSSNIIYLNYKWWDIYNLIGNNHSSITKQLKLFLKENNIAMNKNFNTIDLISLDSISRTISKMDEVIDSVREHFEINFGALSKQSSRSTRLKNRAYFNYKHIGRPHKFNIDIGFMWWGEDDGLIYLVTRLWIPFKGNEKIDIINFFKTELKEWKIESWEDSVVIGNYLNINEVIATRDEQIPTMISFLKDNIDLLIKLKKQNEEIFK